MLTKNPAGHFFLSFCLVAFSAVAKAQLRQPQSSVLQRARSYEPYLQEAAAKYGVEARLLWVIAYLETRFNPLAVSHKGARGLMQFMPATAARWGLQHPHDPIAAIDAAARYVRYLQTSFGRKPELILAAYNAGEIAVAAYLTGRAIRIGNKVINPANRKTGGIPPYRETQNYVATGLQLLGSGLSSEQATAAFLPLTTRPSAGRRKTKAVITSFPQQPSKSISFSDRQGEKSRVSAPVRRSVSFQETP
jgi:soluble lytic murein transglycosylase-like protein